MDYDLIVKLKTIKILEENLGENLCGLELGKMFLAMIPKAQTIKKNNKSGKVATRTS